MPKNRSKRIALCMLGTVGFAALIVPVTPVAQEIDNRPIYYVMLKSLEDGFQAYNASLAADLKARNSMLQSEFGSRLEGVQKEFEALESERARRESAFNSERDALNQRIAALNEQMALRDGRIGEERRIEKRHAARYASNPQISALSERIAAQLAKIDAVRSSYLTQSAATEKARANLASRIEEYLAAGDPLALEIRALEEDWQRYAEAEQRKLKQAADAYAVDYAAYDKWLEDEREVVEKMRAAVASALESNRKQRAEYAETEKALRTLIDEYNGLVEVHNKAGADDPKRDERVQAFAVLDGKIAELQTRLARTRSAVVKLNEELEESNRKYTERYEGFAVEKRERDASLAADLAELNALRLQADADIDAQRKRVDAQIKALEIHISGEIEDARKSLETLNARLIENFGDDNEGLDVGITRVLENNDDAFLYTPAGAPRYDLSRPQTAALYSAVEQLDADRREIDARIVAIEDSEVRTPQVTDTQRPASAALEQQRAALSVERQQLLEAHTSFAREYQAKATAIEQRRQDIESRFSEERALLGEFYSARAGVTRSEMQAVQRVLVAAVKGSAATAHRPSDHSRLVNALTEKSRQMGTAADASLQAPHALLSQIVSELPAESDAHSGGWRSFTMAEVTSSRALSGADKAALSRAWAGRFRLQPQFAAIADDLDASGAVTNGEQALGSLFIAGVMAHMAITGHKLDDGGIGIQVSILGRAYQLDANGFLERLPGG